MIGSRWLLMGFSLGLASCGLVDDGDPGGWALQPEGELEEVSGVGVVLPVEVQGLRPKVGADCVESAWSDRIETNEAAVGSVAGLTEVFGADGCLTERTIREHDAHGRVEHALYDFFDDTIRFNSYVPITPTSTRWTYGPRGEVLQLEVAPWHDQPPTFVEITEYDEELRPIERTRLGDQWWLSDRVLTETWRFASDGLVTRYEMYENEHLTMMNRVELDDAGRAERRFQLGPSGEFLALQNQYGADGELTMQTAYDAGRRVTSTTRFVYSGGVLASKTQDDAARGWRNFWRFDGAGNQLLYAQDSNLDGVWDFEEERRFDVRGNETFHDVRYDFAGHRQATRGTTVERGFDASDRMVWERVYSRSFQASPAARSLPVYSELTRSYAVDGSFEETRTAVHGGQAEGHPTLRRHVRADGQPSWEMQDVERDGSMDRRTDWTYDASGALVALVRDDDLDGTPDSTSVWARDDQGRVVSELHDVDADGVADARTEHRFGATVELPASSVGTDDRF